MSKRAAAPLSYAASLTVAITGCRKASHADQHSTAATRSPNSLRLNTIQLWSDVFVIDDWR